MYLTNEEFNTIKKALELLPQGEEFNNLSEEKQNIIVNADSVMVKLFNKKASKYIADKRKTNKNYAR